MAGGVNAAKQIETEFTIENFVVKAEMIPRKT